MSHQFRILGNNWAWNNYLWVDLTYNVHSSTLQINNPNREALTCDLNWLLLLLWRKISHHFTFSSHLGNTTSYHLQSLSVKPHFCCPEASDSLPAWTVECVKIKGDFCHYPVWTPRYADGEVRFFPGKVHLHRMSRAAWNPITTAGKKRKEKAAAVILLSMKVLKVFQLCSRSVCRESKSSLLRFKANQTKRVHIPRGSILDHEKAF